MNKIISNFYLIKVGGKPSYVGYTNRPIETRFKEHLKDKDFGDETVDLKSLGSLEYDFTWDEELINRYSMEVHTREASLIEEYGTQDSLWQKGTSGNLGGQTWANVKYFIRTNRDNPKFRGLPEEAILGLIEYQRKMIVYLKSVISNTKHPDVIRLGGIIRGTKPSETNRLNNVVRGTKPPEVIRLNNVVLGTKPPEDTRLKNVIKHTKPPEDTRLRSVVTNTKALESTRLANVIRHTKSQVAIKRGRMK